MSDSEDILVEIPDEDLPKLAEIYEKHKRWVPHVYSLIKTGIEWRKQTKGRCLKFMTPNNNLWKVDGTFFAFLMANSSVIQVFIFTLDKTGKDVYDAVIKTRTLDTVDLDREFLFYATHEGVYPALQRALIDKKVNIVDEFDCNIYAIPNEDALKFEIECPPGVYIKRIGKEYAEKINSAWPHRHKNSVKYVASLLEMNDSCGIFLKSNNELVSWVLGSLLGQLCLAQTVETHLKKGYATIAIKYLSKEIAKKGHDVMATVVVENVAALKLFQKLGFKNLCLCTFTTI